MQQELMSTIEIRALLGVVRQRAYQITQHPGFPPPIAELGIGKVWDGAAVRTWAAHRANKTTTTQPHPSPPDPRAPAAQLPPVDWPPVPDHLLDGNAFEDVTAQHQHRTASSVSSHPTPPTQELDPWDYPDDDPGTD
jgi:hypothetical protein